MGENHFAPVPTAAYGFVLLMAAIAYYILQRAIIAHQGRDSLLAAALGRDWKGKLSPVIYLARFRWRSSVPGFRSAVYTCGVYLAGSRSPDRAGAGES